MLATGSNYNFTGGTLNNTGTVNLQRSLTLGAANTGTVNLNAGGTLNNIAALTNAAGHTQANAGMLNILSGATLSNAGILNNSGSITNAGYFTSSDTVSGSGTFTQTGGITQINGSFTQGQIDIQGGTLSGSGTLHADVTNSGGSIGPGNSPGTLTIDGNFTQGSGGIFTAEIGGLLAGTEYDVLDITGTAFLDGILDVDLYDLGSGLFAPVLGDSFDILTAEMLSGSFSSLDFAILTGGLGWQVDYLTDVNGTTDIVRLSVVSAVPLPASAWLFGSGVLGLAGIARRKRQRAA